MLWAGFSKSYVIARERLGFRFSSILQSLTRYQPVGAIEIDSSTLLVSSARPADTAENRFHRDDVRHRSWVPNLTRDRDWNSRVARRAFHAEIAGHQKLALAGSLLGTLRAGHLMCHRHQDFLVRVARFGQ
jgi:hypothetical protein